MDHLKYLPDGAINGIARMVLAGVHLEYPHQPTHVVMSSTDVRVHRALHPAFFGSYDWHSAVHSHWAILKLLELASTAPDRRLMEETMAAHLSLEFLQLEAAYFKEPGRAAFERPYGWAWIWKLTSDLARSPLPQAASWYANIRPLADFLAKQFVSWLGRQSYPCRAGTHGNTAFAMAFGLDFSQACGDPVFGTEISASAIRLFGNDRGFTLAMEPSNNDFISPMLAEVCLMGRVLPAAEWRSWLSTLLPTAGELQDLKPVVVTDRGDAQGVHLDGLNLSRAYHLAVTAGLPGDMNLRRRFAQAADSHWQVGVSHLFTGDFLAEHWLGSFAILAALELAAISEDCQ